MNAVDLLNKLLQDNGLTLTLSPIQTRMLQDGGFIVEKPTLVVDFTKGAPNEPEKTEERPVEGETVA